MDDRSSMPEGEPEFGGVLGDASLLDEGDALTVVWGKESYSPIRYFNVEIGPFSATVRIRKGESPGQARDRANKVLEAIASEEWKKKVKSHLRRIPQTHELAQAMKGKV